LAAGTAPGVGLPLTWWRPFKDGAGTLADLALATLAFSRSFSFFFMAREIALMSSSLAIEE
jgi:hypothetical protein